MYFITFKKTFFHINFFFHKQWVIRWNGTRVVSLQRSGRPVAHPRAACVLPTSRHLSPMWRPPPRFRQKPELGKRGLTLRCLLAEETVPRGPQPAGRTWKARLEKAACSKNHGVDPASRRRSFASQVRGADELVSLHRREDIHFGSSVCGQCPAMCA